jgi:hypothetical protein
MEYKMSNINTIKIPIEHARIVEEYLKEVVRWMGFDNGSEPIEKFEELRRKNPLGELLQNEFFQILVNEMVFVETRKTDIEKNRDNYSQIQKQMNPNFDDQQWLKDELRAYKLQKDYLSNALLDFIDT